MVAAGSFTPVGADDSGDITEPIRVEWAFGNEFCQVHWQVNISRLSSHRISNYGWNSWSEAELKHGQQPMTYCNVGAFVAGLVAEPEIFLCHRRSTLTKSTGYGCSLNEQNRNSQIGSNNCSAILVKTLISTQHDWALKSLLLRQCWRSSCLTGSWVSCGCVGTGFRKQKC